MQDKQDKEIGTDKVQRQNKRVHNNNNNKTALWNQQYNFLHDTSEVFSWDC